MNLDKTIIEAISQVTGIPASEITQDKVLGKDLGISEVELNDVLTNLREALGFEINREERELTTVQDLVVLVHESQPLA